MNNLQLTGLHHVSARTRQIGINHDFYTQIMGLRLVKKSVNQDDTRMYHLFYADQVGSPGSDMTFFDLPMAVREHKGTNSITRTTFRVTGVAALQYWAERLTQYDVPHSAITTFDGRAHLNLEDPDGTPLSLVDDGGQGPRGIARTKSDIPTEFQIQGLGYGGITVSDLGPTRDFMERCLNLREVRHYPVPEAQAHTVHVFEMGPESGAGPHTELHIIERNDLPQVQPGAGGVHHIALTIPDAVGIEPWLAHFDREGFRNTGLVDRFYFKSVYLRDPHGIVIELATEGPGFHADEPIDVLGERLALPPFLENRRAEIEANLKPIVTGVYLKD